MIFSLQTSHYISFRLPPVLSVEFAMTYLDSFLTFLTDQHLFIHKYYLSLKWHAINILDYAHMKNYKTNLIQSTLKSSLGLLFSTPHYIIVF